MSSAEAAPGGIGRASAWLASGTLVSRLLGFVKAAVLAHTIGFLAAGDAFTIGNQLPNLIYELVAGGILSAVLIPQIVRAGLHDDGGQRFINKLVTVGIVVFVVITAIATLAAPWLVDLFTQSTVDGKGAGFTPEGLALATAFAYWCLPQILFYAIYSLLGEVLNARKVFGPFTWAPVLNNVVAIAGLIVFMGLFGDASANSSPDVWTPAMIALLAGSSTLGIAAQAGVLAFFWRRTSLRFRPDFRWAGVGLGSTAKAAGWLFAMVLVSQLAGIVQINVVSLATGTGTSNFAIATAWLIFMVPFSVIAVSIMTVYFTRMSGHATTGNYDGVRSDLSSSIRAIGVILVFAMVAMIVAAYPLSRIFTSNPDVIIGMGNLVIAFALGTVPFSMVFVLQRTFYALEDTRTVFFIVFAKSTVFVGGLLLVALLPVEQIGVGVALLTSAIAFIYFGLAFIVLRRRLGNLDGRLLLWRHTQYLAAGVVAGAVGFGILFLLGGYHPAGFALSNWVTALVAIVIVGAVMAPVYVAVLLTMRNPELRTLSMTIRSRFGRG
ncbi:murein biosynthesis integral membrane protein MurJ [Homoserinimonas sp. A447]